MDLPRIELSEADTLWLKTSVNLFLANEPYRYQDVLRLLWEKVPEGYEPDAISHLLFYSSYQPTLYGIWHIYPEHSILTEVDQVIEGIVDILKENPDTEEVSATELATKINLSKERTGIILQLLGSLGSFYRSASSSGLFVGLDNIRFGYNEREIIQEYRAYKGLENAIRKKIEKDRKREFEYAAMVYKNSLHQINELIEDFYEDAHANEPLYQELKSKLLEASKLGMDIPKPISETTSFMSLIEYLDEDVNSDSESSDTSGTVIEGQCSDLQVEQSLLSESTALVSSALSESEYEILERLWRKAYTRCESDPDGAITAAKSLLESTLKSLLDSSEVEFPESCDLPKLYTLIKKPLKLEKDDVELPHIVKALGSCTNLVHFLTEVRNDFGDAHGSSNESVLHPSQDITRLTISVSGHVSIWLIKRYRSILSEERSHPKE